MKRWIHAKTANKQRSEIQLDFAFKDDYEIDDLQDIAETALKTSGGQLETTIFNDLKGTISYPGKKDYQVGQASIIFTWSAGSKYDKDAMEGIFKEELPNYDYELVRIKFKDM